MSVVELSLVLILLLFAILGTGVWIAIALAVCGFAAVMTKASVPAGQVFATSVWAASDSWDLTALPMFHSYAMTTCMNGTITPTQSPSATARGTDLTLRCHSSGWLSCFANGRRIRWDSIVSRVGTWRLIQPRRRETTLT